MGWAMGKSEAPHARMFPAFASVRACCCSGVRMAQAQRALPVILLGKLHDTVPRGQPLYPGFG